MEHVYCYVDETGQDTGGNLFTVCCSIIVSVEERDRLEQLIISLENETKKKTKWQSTNKQIRIRFLEAVLGYQRDLKGCIFVQHFYQTKDFVASTVEAVARSIQKSGNQGRQAIIYVDGLSKRSVLGFATFVRRFGIHTEKVKGLKDEQSPLIRLSDAIAGFVRDYLEGQDYTKKYYLAFLNSKIITEI